MNLQQLLQRLSELEPEVCRLEPEPPDEIYYKIGGYVFFFIDGEFSAGHKDHIGRTQYYTGPPALAWLRDAVERAIEARGWYAMQEYRPDMKPHYVAVGHVHYGGTSAAHALLAAFVAACEAAQPNSE